MALLEGSEILAQRRRKVGLSQRKVKRGFEVSEFGTDVVPNTRKLASIQWSIFKKLPQSVRELNLTVRIRAGLLEDLENVRGQNVATDDGQARRCGLRVGLFDKVADAKDTVADRYRVDHTVAANRLARDAFDKYYRTSELVEQVAHLTQRRWIRVNYVVWERHGERSVVDGMFGHQHCMTETERISLVDGRHLRHRGHRAHRLKCVGLPTLLEKVFEPRVSLKIRRRHRIVRARDEDDPVNTGRDGLLNAALNHRTIDKRKELFGQRFRGGEDARTEASNWKDDSWNRGLHSV